MAFKDLFIKSEDSKEEKKEDVVVEQYTPKFPVNESSTTTTSFPDTAGNVNEIPEPAAPTPVALNCKPHMDSIMGLYEKGFSDLNKPGYDFFEFFKAVSGGGASNPQVYDMALTMGTSMDPTVTKEKLLSEADYYINEIINVYNTYVSNGNTKKETTIQKQTTERAQLTTNLERLKREAAELASKINTAEGELKVMDGRYKPIIEDIDCKLMANDVAKGKILDSIETVKAGIINNLK